MLWTIEHPYAEAESPFTELLRLLVGERVRITPFRELLAHQEVIKVVVTGKPGLLDEVGRHIEQAVPELKRSTREFYDAPPPGSSKGEALDKVLARLSIQHEQCVGIGDGDADIEWMAKLGHPIAMANASHGVRAISAEVIGDHDEDGVARYLEESLLQD